MRNLLLGIALVLGLASCGNRCEPEPETGIVFTIDNATSFVRATGDNIVVEESLAGFNLLILHPNLSGEFVELRIDVAARELTFFRMEMFGIRINNDEVLDAEVFAFGTEEFDCYRFLSPNDDFKTGSTDLSLRLSDGRETRITIDWTGEVP